MACVECGGPKGLSSCFLSPDLCFDCDQRPRPRDAWDIWLDYLPLWAVVLLVGCGLIKAWLS